MDQKPQKQLIGDDWNSYLNSNENIKQKRKKYKMIKNWCRDNKLVINSHELKTLILQTKIVSPDLFSKKI